MQKLVTIFIFWSILAGSDNLRHRWSDWVEASFQSGANVNMLLRSKLPSSRFRSRQELLAFIDNVANKTHLPTRLLRAVIAVESSYCQFRFNGQDYGCGQINIRTLQAMGWNVDTVHNNDKAGVWAAALVLRAFKRSHGRLETQTWPSQYNVGYRQLPAVQARYMRRLAFYGYR